MYKKRSKSSSISKKPKPVVAEDIADSTEEEEYVISTPLTKTKRLKRKESSDIVGFNLWLLTIVYTLHWLGYTISKEKTPYSIRNYPNNTREKSKNAFQVYRYVGCRPFALLNVISLNEYRSTVHT